MVRAAAAGRNAITLVTHCICTDRSFADLLALARARGLDVAGLGSATGAGDRCTLCRPYLEAALRTGTTAIPLRPAIEIPLPQAELDRRVLFENDEVVVVDKPWGLPSTGRLLHDRRCLQYALMQRYVSMTWAAHQLDADTSGINVFVRRRDRVGHWQARLRHPVGEKSYLAVVHGEMTEDRCVEAPIGVVRETPSRSLGITPTGRRALSRFAVLERGAGFSLVRVRIETGRTHQIRIHAASIGHPLVGECWYRDEPCHHHPRQALHAWSLHFHDGAEPAGFVCDPPVDLLELIAGLGWSPPRYPAA